MHIVSQPVGLRRTGSRVTPLGHGVTVESSISRCLDSGSRSDHPNPSELSGRLISVNLPGDGSCVNVRLEGEIKNATVTMSRDLRVGIEFIGLSETEQAITAVLSVMSDVLVNA